MMIKNIIIKIQRFFNKKPALREIIDRYGVYDYDIGYEIRNKYLIIEFEIEDRYGEKYIDKRYGSITGTTINHIVFHEEGLAMV